MINCPHCSTVNPDFAESCSRCGTPMPLGESETIQMVDATVIAPGSDFGPRYRIDALLGQGGMGRVYKAYDKELDRTVAIKVVREGAIGQADALKRFKQELVLASKISHKNILRIHDMGDVGGLRFISMAFVEGRDLQHIIHDNPKMPMDRILNFARQIAEALAAAHAEGVVHRDLKPQNLLVDKNDQIFVCDFGLAKSFEEGAIGMTRTGAFLGTPRYMSPEQVEGKPADNRADLYSYGLILYEMVTGDVPFTGESTLKVMYQRIQEKPKSPKLVKPDLPNWLVRIIMRCLERNPDDRYQNAYEILADLQGSLSGAGVSRSGISRMGSGSQSVVIQIPEFASRRWVWVVSGGLALLLVLFAIPPIRHLIPGFRVEPIPGAAISGIPPLSSGRYVAVLPLQIEPPRIPNAEVAFWTRPQNSVAGDYYDAFYPGANGTSNGKLMLVMADVAGKSVPAALLMATLQASLHTLASEHMPLLQLADRLNRYACAHSLGGQRFTTAVLAEYDPETRRLEYVNAGHNAPVVRRPNGGTDRLESSGMPLGISPDATFSSSSLELHPGDTLVLFTDGVVEAFNASGEEFSDARWVNAIRGLQALPAQETLRQLMKTVDDFVGTTRQSDDITCLVLQSK